MTTDYTVTEPGDMEGHICNRDGCKGVIELLPVEDCSCHISPPCGACVGQKATCPECDWMSEDP